jgi:LacI family transcriptional regulator
MNAARERGLVVGRDISVTGFDDIMLAEYASPPLTTVHQPAHQLGAMVAAMLLKVIEGEPVEKKQVIVKTTLKLRDSTGRPP